MVIVDLLTRLNAEKGRWALLQACLDGDDAAL
jgi:hypothetical protein